MSVLSFPYSAIPASAARVEVADGVFWLRFSLPFALDHINLWLLRDGEGWMLVDTGFGSNRTREEWLQAERAVLEGRPITRILVTHYHPDHVGQAAWLVKHWNAPVFMTAGEWGLTQRLFATEDVTVREQGAAFLKMHGLAAERADLVLAGGNGFRRAVPALPADVRLVQEGDQLSVDNKIWTLVCGSGHSPEHACLYRADDGVLISGDQVLPTISSNISVRREEPEADPLADFLDSLRKLGALPEDTLVLPAHGLPFQGLRRRTQALLEHHQRHLSRIESLCLQSPASAADLLPVLFRPNLNDHEVLFAMGESIAHVNHLYHQGRLERVEGEVMRFSC